MRDFEHQHKHEHEHEHQHETQTQTQTQDTTDERVRRACTKQASEATNHACTGCAERRGRTIKAAAAVERRGGEGKGGVGPNPNLFSCMTAGTCVDTSLLL